MGRRGRGNKTVPYLCSGILEANHLKSLISHPCYSHIFISASLGYETSNLRALQRAIKAMTNSTDDDTLMSRTTDISGQSRTGFSCEKNESQIMEEWINSSTFFLIHKWKYRKTQSNLPRILGMPLNYLCFGFEFYKQWCICACKNEKKLYFVQYKDRQCSLLLNGWIFITRSITAKQLNWVFFSVWVW